MKKYYGIIYLKNGDAFLCSACESEEEVREAMANAIRKHVGIIDKIKATSYMCREEESLMDILGHPKSRDLLQDRKFLTTL